MRANEVNRALVGKHADNSLMVDKQCTAIVHQLIFTLAYLLSDGIRL